MRYIKWEKRKEVEGADRVCEIGAKQIAGGLLCKRLRLLLSGVGITHLFQNM